MVYRMAHYDIRSDLTAARSVAFGQLDLLACRLFAVVPISREVLL